MGLRRHGMDGIGWDGGGIRTFCVEKLTILDTRGIETHARRYSVETTNDALADGVARPSEKTYNAGYYGGAGEK